MLSSRSTVAQMAERAPRAQKVSSYQVIIAQRLARQLASGDVSNSNPGKGDNLLISDCIFVCLFVNYNDRVISD